ncbi:hypothetical protein QYF36_022754 [Acer negundo]|nr:hypothetical protein QYF36_022754 [Acer negundo]
MSSIISLPSQPINLPFYPSLSSSPSISTSGSQNSPAAVSPLNRQVSITAMTPFVSHSRLAAPADTSIRRWLSLTSSKSPDPPRKSSSLDHQTAWSLLDRGDWMMRQLQGGDQDFKYEENSVKAVQCLNEMVTDALKHEGDCLYHMSALKDNAALKLSAMSSVIGFGTLALCYNNIHVFKAGVKLRPGN